MVIADYVDLVELFNLVVRASDQLLISPEVANPQDYQRAECYPSMDPLLVTGEVWTDQYGRALRPARVHYPRQPNCH